MAICKQHLHVAQTLHPRGYCPWCTAKRNSSSQSISTLQSRFKELWSVKSYFAPSPLNILIWIFFRLKLSLYAEPKKTKLYPSNRVTFKILIGNSGSRVFPLLLLIIMIYSTPHLLRFKNRACSRNCCIDLVALIWEDSNYKTFNVK